MPSLRNAKHEKFAQHLADGKTQTDAYSEAGFKPSRSNAATLAKQPEILERVSELLERRQHIVEQATAKAVERAAEQSSLSKKWVLDRLIENVERAMQLEQVKDRKGAPTGELTYEGQVANRALELLGKELGMFIERKEVGQPGDFEKLDDDELERKLAEYDAHARAEDREAPASGGEGTAYH